jgi:hypothetical protein
LKFNCRSAGPNMDSWFNSSFLIGCHISNQVTSNIMVWCHPSVFKTYQSVPATIGNPFSSYSSTYFLYQVIYSNRPSPTTNARPLWNDTLQSKDWSILHRHSAGSQS